MCIIMKNPFVFCPLWDKPSSFSTIVSSLIGGWWTAYLASGSRKSGVWITKGTQTTFGKNNVLVESIIADTCFRNAREFCRNKKSESW